jgi:hypothetical protein
VKITVLALALFPAFADAAHRARAVVVVSAGVAAASALPPAGCRCGDSCPLKGTCGDNCGCAAIPARPEGDGWQWDATRRAWWRYVTGPTRSHTPAAPIPGFSAFGTVPMAFPSRTNHAPVAYSRGAASCTT